MTLLNGKVEAPIRKWFATYEACIGFWDDNRDHIEVEGMQVRADGYYLNYWLKD